MKYLIGGAVGVLATLAAGIVAVVLVTDAIRPHYTTTNKARADRWNGWRELDELYEESR